MKKFLFKIVSALFLLLYVPSSVFAVDEEPVLNIYNWSGFITSNVINKFERETGIKIIYDSYDSNYMMESKLIATGGEYDIAFPTFTPFMEGQIALGLYQKLDLSKLSNYVNLDKKLLDIMYSDNQKLREYAIPYVWSTLGIGYNEDKIKQIMPDAPIDSLKLFFDPDIVKHFTKCGVSMIDSPADIMIMANLYLGLPVNSQKMEDLSKSENALKKIRPYITNIHSANYIDNLANGDSCLVFGHSGDIIQAQLRAQEVGNNIKIKYSLPKEGSEIGFDAMGILTKARHPNNAYKFINFLLRPEISAEISNNIGYISANRASYPLLREYIKGNDNIMLSNEKFSTLFKSTLLTPDFKRKRARAWIRIINKDS